MKKNIILISSGILILLLAGGICLYRCTVEIFPGVRCFCPGERGRDGFPPHPGMKMLAMLKRELRLTDAQYGILLKSGEKNSALIAKNGERSAALIANLKNELMKPALDEKAVRALLAGIDETLREDRIVHFRALFELRKVLTAEQVTLLEKSLDRKFGKLISHMKDRGRRADD